MKRLAFAGLTLLGSLMGCTQVVKTSDPALVSIAVTPLNPSVRKGTIQSFMATGTFSDSGVRDITARVSWTSSATSVATINSSGVATALAEGATAIAATSETISGVTTMTVTPSVSIGVTPVRESPPKGSTKPGAQ